MGIVEGRVLKKRNLGGIIFLRILSESCKKFLIARRDLMDHDLFIEVGKIQVNSFCRFDVNHSTDECYIIRMISQIKPLKDCFWSEDRIDILQAYSCFFHLLRQYFEQKGYTEVHLPSIHYGDHKKEAFTFDFFSQPARLTTSNALYLNVYATQLSKVFSIQKCFRAEKSKTNRHLAEFDLLEVALLNKNIQDCMNEVEQIVKYVIHGFSISEFCNMLKIDVDLVLKSSFPTIEYQVISKKYDIGINGLGKLEREIAQSIPLFITNFPRGIGSWMAKSHSNGYSMSFNLLVPEVGEAAEGNEKQTDLKFLAKKLEVANVQQQLNWYLQMMPYSNFLLSGFGLGLERVFMWLFGIKNIRGIQPVYRDTHFSEIKLDGEIR